MISILIHTYNYDICSLVHAIHKQVIILNIKFEVIVIDDFSTDKKSIQKNKAIAQHEYCEFIELHENIGRSKIRNLLAKRAKYDCLLFLDADVEILKSDFIKIYLDKISAKTQVIYGGITYQKNKPSANKILRWTYGTKREALTVTQRKKKPHLSFLTLNFIIHKNVFDSVYFNEDIPNLRHEDTLFALDLKKNKILVEHIDNPIIHLGLDSNESFIKKSEEAVDAILLFKKQNLIKPKDVKITRVGKNLHLLKFIFSLFFKIFKNSMTKNLVSKKPSLFIFDLYRLGYLFTSKKSHNA